MKQISLACSNLALDEGTLQLACATGETAVSPPSGRISSGSGAGFSGRKLEELAAVYDVTGGDKRYSLYLG